MPVNNVTDFSQCAGTGTETANPGIFGGDSDLGLLSRYPILKQESRATPIFQRGTVLYAKIDVPTLGPVHAFCTHLSSSLRVIPYAGPDRSWDGEHRREVAQLANFIQVKTTARNAEFPRARSPRQRHASVIEKERTVWILSFARDQRRARPSCLQRIERGVCSAHGGA
jgi:hypothetical protein